MKLLFRKYKRLVSAPLFGTGVGVGTFFLTGLPLQLSAGAIALGFVLPFGVMPPLPATSWMYGRSSVVEYRVAEVVRLTTDRRAEKRVK